MALGEDKRADGSSEPRHACYPLKLFKHTMPEGTEQRRAGTKETGGAIMRFLGGGVRSGKVNEYLTNQSLINEHV